MIVTQSALLLALVTTPQHWLAMQKDWASESKLPAPVITSPASKRIEVSLKTQTLTAYAGETPVYTFNCSTGKNNGTPSGTFPIRQKVRFNTALPEYGSAPIPYSLRLDIVINGVRKRIAIHAYKSVPRYPASHGCIRLKHADAAKLFDWAPVGIPVSIQ